ncbi:acid phosphatase pho5 [Aspergillus tubingensis]|uniref:histidine phosphatase family protein n=1 Tax=Aspergillus tubingensis TaxID=5068 RepID=UPI00157888FA|nr:3-phytase B precursor [Aspergillus tubingensis]GFN12981.1 3-phytase B precursor [Aspergillus tubingensis]GLA56871.1 acid phosphatase pho5 [Aspergillus tubingensis]
MARLCAALVCLWSIPATTALSSSYTFSDSLISQQVLDGENFLKYDGVRGPYVDRISYGISRDPPAQCSVDQVIMVKRHGERYPTSGEGTSIEQALKKVNDSIAGNYSSGDLAFLENWTYFVPSDCYEAETSTGPYAGLTDAYNHGKAYRQRYGNLYNESTILPLFTADFQRIISTAQNFGQGFLGNDSYATKAALNIISESDSQGADSLTPTCHVQDDDAQSICGDMPYYLPQFDVAADRLNAQYQGLNLNWTDVYSLILMTAYELNTRSSSPWIDVFTTDEWISFAHLWNVNFYYCAGPGNKYTRALGALYLNATLTLLQQGPSSSGPLFFNFAHDSNITPIITALGIATPTTPLNKTRIPFPPSAWSVQDIVPMGGRLTIERMNCTDSALAPGGIFVRLVLNEAVVPLENCQSGPGYSCPLDEYADVVGSLPSYVSECEVPEDDKQDLQFWWRWNTSTAENFRMGGRCGGLA